jgi:putative transposase
MNKNETPESIAGKRLVMITPLLDENLGKGEIGVLKKQICEKHDISYRTLSRYLQAYLQFEFEGLKPKTGYKRSNSDLPSNFDEVIEHAIILRRENPSRSVNDIIRILELEGFVRPGLIKRSTLQRHLQSAGFGQRQMKMYSQKGAAAKRYQKLHRSELWQCDIKYGCHLPIGKNGEMKQIYLSAFIDDATRFVVSAKFYDNQTVDIIEDSLRNAIMCFGKPQKLLTDNGKQYRSEWLKKACNRLGIRLTHCKPYAPEGKGKIEFFNKRVDSFLSEVALDKPSTLEALNESFDIWLQDYYHANPHSAIGNISPATAFRGDKAPLTFVSAETLSEAFLRTETRRVDKIGCVSFKGDKYEAGTHLMGRKVEIHYDPTWIDEIEIHHKDFKPFKAKRQIIGEDCYNVDKKIIKALEPITTNGSRLLSALKANGTSEKINKEVATRFKDLGGVDHV